MWTFERAQEPIEISNEPMSGSQVILALLGIFIGKSGLNGYFHIFKLSFWTQTSTRILTLFFFRQNLKLCQNLPQNFQKFSPKNAKIQPEFRRFFFHFSYFYSFTTTYTLPLPQYYISEFGIQVFFVVFQVPCIKYNYSNNSIGDPQMLCCSGYCIDLLDKLSNALNFTYELHISKDGTFGNAKSVSTHIVIFGSTFGRQCIPKSQKKQVT